MGNSYLKEGNHKGSLKDRLTYAREAEDSEEAYFCQVLPLGVKLRQRHYGGTSLGYQGLLQE